MSLAIAMPSTSSSARSVPKMRSALSALLAQSGGSSCVSVLMMRRFWSAAVVRSDTDRAAVATQLTDLETAERVLMRVGKRPPGRRSTSAAAAEAKAPTATRGRLGRPPKAAPSKSAGRKLSAPSLGERVLALATGKTRQELYLACPNDRPNHIGMAVQRHIRAGRIQERDGKLHATSPATEQAHATA